MFSSKGFGSTFREIFLFTFQRYSQSDFLDSKIFYRSILQPFGLPDEKPNCTDASAPLSTTTKLRMVKFELDSTSGYATYANRMKLNIILVFSSFWFSLGSLLTNAHCEVRTACFSTVTRISLIYMSYIRSRR